ncbi:MAG TPA: DUF1573 domain-containing protein [Blastocatellia bacterium]|nr:DUF1573 domain-containing protein [Blastocatellia bacterium]HST20144.1 DUF1573 domain-containing protein [Blastocatellia bacterium]
MKSKLTIVLFALLMVSAFSVAASENPQPGGPKLVIASLEHSFGKVKPGTPLTYTFTIKNQGDSNLEITNVAPSCGCTTSEFDKVIAPGKEGKVILEVKKTDGYKGEVTKNATVTTNDPNHQTFQLILRANFSDE